ERPDPGAVNRVNVGAMIEQQRHHVCRSADDRTVQGMAPGAVDIVNERWLLLEEGAHARQRAGFGGSMDRMILGRSRGHEPARPINHVRGSYYLSESPQTRGRTSTLLRHTEINDGLAGKNTMHRPSIFMVVSLQRSGRGPRASVRLWSVRSQITPGHVVN